MKHNPDSEQALEDATVELFETLGYETVNAYDETFGADGTLGRETRGDVVLVGRLRPALEALNPDLPDDAITNAIEALTTDRSLMTPAAANQEIHHMLKHGVRVTYRDHDGGEAEEVVQVIDWKQPENNDFLVVQQLWGASALYTRRPDLVIFVNGLPLVLIELKASHKNVRNAYNHNLRDYKDTLPEYFWYNSFIILSNGRYSRIGSLSASWEHFSEWKKINSEGEEGRISLETIIKGTCEPSKLLDIVESFTLFQQSPAGLIKIIARNHQYLGVNNAIRGVDHIRENQGRLGVFWHTQGSGKSYSMVFFSQKILRKLPGNWTFLIVTDRDELDNQIYKTFADVGAVPPVKSKKGNVQAESGEELKRLLREDHRYVFTLIQKFHTRDGQPYPVLSERDDIIVITDEAHRSQYDTFAANMRRALPNAAFIGFTGTPLMAGEEKTRQVFGDYVSVYNFKQSVDDQATVPLHYENRIPQLQLANQDLNADMEALLEQAMLDDQQETALERQFAREYQLITRVNRLETIAEDIVEHFMQRGFAGREHNSKAMVVAIDKVTAVRMYDLVRKHWQIYLERLEQELSATTDEEQQAELRQKISYIRETDMAVVISQSQNEVDDFRRRGMDILPHRERMVKEDLATKFKDVNDPFRLVFVCAMWMTGFDAPACATIYLDKPMRNHTLMQTIARANRVFKDKHNGLIVDYIGVFRNLERALSIYGSASGGGLEEGEMPVRDKSELVQQLRSKIAEAVQFCAECGIDLDAIRAARGYDREKLKADAVEALLRDEETTRRYFIVVREINRLFRSILPSPDAAEFDVPRRLFNVIAEAILEDVPDADISHVEGGVGQVLDASIITEKYVIEGAVNEHGRQVDLSQIDIDALRERFARGHKRTAIEKMRGAINRRLQRMVGQNRTRLDFLEMFQRLIDDYNTGAVDVEAIFERLVTFVIELDQEELRTIAENLTEEELAIFDLLTRPDIDLTPQERDLVKKVAQELLRTLKHEKLVLDWRKHQQTRAEVEHTIKLLLDRELPDEYTADLYEAKCSAIYQHIFEAYHSADNSIYVA
jgi:type I restriction enzyme, R subunit